MCIVGWGWEVVCMVPAGPVCGLYRVCVWGKGGLCVYYARHLCIWFEIGATCVWLEGGSNVSVYCV